MELEKNEPLVQMSETNKQFVKRILEFETDLQRNDKIIEDMKKDTEKYGQRIAFAILRTVFTSGQVKRLITPIQKRIKWTTEDISSAIALRSKRKGIQILTRGYKDIASLRLNASELELQFYSKTRNFI